MVRSKNKSRGFTLIEMVLVLAGLVIFLSVVFAVYRSRVEPNSWASNKFQTFQSVVSALESAKSANGGAYPAATNVSLSNSTAPSDPKAKLVWSAVTGGVPTSDINGWTYSCSGNTITLTVDLSDRPTSAAGNIFVSSVNSNTPFSGTWDGSSATVNFTRAGVLCR